MPQPTPDPSPITPSHLVRLEVARLNAGTTDRLSFCTSLFSQASKLRIPYTDLHLALTTHNDNLDPSLDLDFALILTSLYAALAPELFPSPPTSPGFVSSTGRPRSVDTGEVLPPEDPAEDPEPFDESTGPMPKEDPTAEDLCHLGHHLSIGPFGERFCPFCT